MQAAQGALGLALFLAYFLLSDTTPLSCSASCPFVLSGKHFSAFRRSVTPVGGALHYKRRSSLPHLFFCCLLTTPFATATASTSAPSQMSVQTWLQRVFNKAQRTFCPHNRIAHRTSPSVSTVVMAACPSVPIHAGALFPIGKWHILLSSCSVNDPLYKRAVRWHKRRFSL